MRRKRSYISRLRAGYLSTRRRAGLLFVALAVAIVLAVPLVSLLGTTTQSGMKPAAGAIESRISATVGTTSRIQALATTTTQQHSAIPGLSATVSRDTLMVTMIVAAALLAIAAIVLFYSDLSISDLRIKPISKHRREHDLEATLVSKAETDRRRATRPLTFGNQTAGPLRC